MEELQIIQNETVYYHEDLESKHLKLAGALCEPAEYDLLFVPWAVAYCARFSTLHMVSSNTQAWEKVCWAPRVAKNHHSLYKNIQSKRMLRKPRKVQIWNVLRPHDPIYA